MIAVGCNWKNKKKKKKGENFEVANVYFTDGFESEFPAAFWGWLSGNSRVRVGYRLPLASSSSSLFKSQFNG